MKTCPYCKCQFETTNTRKVYCKRDCKEKACKERYPYKASARAIARKLGKGEHICQLCLAKKATDRHHEDYSKPKDVIWLCQKCHHTFHRVKKLAKNFQAENTQIL